MRRTVVLATVLLFVLGTIPAYGASRVVGSGPTADPVVLFPVPRPWSLHGPGDSSIGIQDCTGVLWRIVGDQLLRGDDAVAVVEAGAFLGIDLGERLHVSTGAAVYRVQGWPGWHPARCGEAGQVWQYRLPQVWGGV